MKIFAEDQAQLVNLARVLTKAASSVLIDTTKGAIEQDSIVGVLTQLRDNIEIRNDS